MVSFTGSAGRSTSSFGGISPSVFLPRLPREQPTLTPLTATDLERHVRHLRRLLLPFARGADGNPIVSAEQAESNIPDEQYTGAGIVRKRKRGNGHSKLMATATVTEATTSSSSLLVSDDVAYEALTSGASASNDWIHSGCSKSDLDLNSQVVRQRASSIASSSGSLAIEGLLDGEPSHRSPSQPLKRLELSPRTILSSLPENGPISLSSDIRPRRASVISTSSASTHHRPPSLLRRRSSVRSRYSDQTDAAHVSLDEFERDWSERWLASVVRRGEGWLEDAEDDADEQKARESVLAEASAVISLLAGCSATGSFVRELVFPHTGTDDGDREEEDDDDGDGDIEEFVIKIHDASLSDHLSVGVQTWASSILLGRILARDPKSLWRGTSPQSVNGPRILELGAGTGVLSILCRAILDEHWTSTDTEETRNGESGIVVATDYHPDVLTNLKRCVDLNFGPPEQDDEDETPTPGAYPTNHPDLHILPLDWSTFPPVAEALHRSAESSNTASDSTATSAPSSVLGGIWAMPPDQIIPPGMSSLLAKPFDLILVADCVYDLTHAAMIRDCLKWLLRLPDVDANGDVVDEGGVVHLLSPLRPTYAAETATIVDAFPLVDDLPPRSQRTSHDASPNLMPAGDVPLSSVSSDAPTPRIFSGTATPTIPVPPPTVERLERGLERLMMSDTKANLRGQESASRKHLQDHNQSMRGSGLGEAGGWVLATRKRTELERLQGTGRADESEYWWWEIGWA